MVFSPKERIKNKAQETTRHKKHNRIHTVNGMKLTCRKKKNLTKHKNSQSLGIEFSKIDIEHRRKKPHNRIVWCMCVCRSPISPNRNRSINKFEKLNQSMWKETRNFTPSKQNETHTTEMCMPFGLDRNLNDALRRRAIFIVGLFLFYHL